MNRIVAAAFAVAMSNGSGSAAIAQPSTPGAEVQKPLAVVVIAGLVVATFLTLFVLPAISRLLLHGGRKPHVRGEYAGEDRLGREPLAAR